VPKPKSPDSSTKTEHLCTEEIQGVLPYSLLLQVSYHDIPAPLWLFPVGSETGWRLFDIECGRGLLFELREGISPDKGRFYELEDSWNTKGA